jgi:hypothetical protein
LRAGKAFFCLFLLLGNYWIMEGREGWTDGRWKGGRREGEGRDGMREGRLPKGGNKKEKNFNFSKTREVLAQRISAHRTSCIQTWIRPLFGKSGYPQAVPLPIVVQEVTY